MTCHRNKFTTGWCSDSPSGLVKVEAFFSTLTTTSASPEGTCETTGGGVRGRRGSHSTGVVMGIVAPTSSECQLGPRGPRYQKVSVLGIAFDDGAGLRWGGRLFGSHLLLAFAAMASFCPESACQGWVPQGMGHCVDDDDIRTIMCWFNNL